MKSKEEVDIQKVKTHEEITHSNCKVGTYGMDEHCPLAEFQFYCATLEANDVDRLYLLGEFAKHTNNLTGKLKHVTNIGMDSKRIERINSFINPPSDSSLNPIDLRENSNLELIIVTPDIDMGPFTIIDGNHRAIAQWQRFKSIDGIRAYVCVHPEILKWPYIPIKARG